MNICWPFPASVAIFAPPAISNVSRGKRQKAGNDDAVPCILESRGDEKTFRRNWARLIQKIYEVDPLVCPRCRSAMRVIGSIEDPSVIRAILEHLELWLVRSRPPPKIHDPPLCARRPAASHIIDDPAVSSPSMTITSTRTLSNPVMNTSRHNALKKEACRMGLPEKRLKLPSRRSMRLNDEP